MHTTDDDNETSSLSLCDCSVPAIGRRGSRLVIIPRIVGDPTLEEPPRERIS